MVCEDLKFHIYVGSKIGTFKDVIYNPSTIKKGKNTSRHLINVKAIQKGEGVTCMTFKDDEETEILLGKENRIIQTYNLLNDQFTEQYNVDFGEGKIHSITAYEDTLIGAVQSGIIKIWKSKKVKKGNELNAGPDLECMRHCPDNRKLIATGGKENELKIWDLEKLNTSFVAKNVPHDWLQLRVPIWISDICFMPNTDGRELAISSRYGVVRLYDTRAQRRPVCSVEFPGQAMTCITLGFRERQVLMGTGRGILQMVDLRGPGKPDKSYKGPTGAVTSAYCPPGKSLVVSTSLDRHLRIHNAISKEIIHKQYMTTKLTTLLVRSSDKTPLPYDVLENNEEVKNETIKDELFSDPEEKIDSEYEELFENMEVIGDESDKKKVNKKKSKVKQDSKKSENIEDLDESIKVKKTKKHKIVESTEETPSGKSKSKKGRKSISNVDTTQDIDTAESPRLDDSIKMLLKNTEKRKKEIAKKKLEKKRKSVFNC